MKKNKLSLAIQELTTMFDRYENFRNTERYKRDSEIYQEMFRAYCAGDKVKYHELNATRDKELNQEVRDFHHKMMMLMVTVLDLGWKKYRRDPQFKEQYGYHFRTAGFLYERCRFLAEVVIDLEKREESKTISEA